MFCSSTRLLLHPYMMSKERKVLKCSAVMFEELQPMDMIAGVLCVN